MRRVAAKELLRLRASHLWSTSCANSGVKMNSTKSWRLR